MLQVSYNKYTVNTDIPKFLLLKQKNTEYVYISDNSTTKKPCLHIYIAFKLQYQETFLHEDSEKNNYNIINTLFL